MPSTRNGAALQYRRNHFFAHDGNGLRLPSAALRFATYDEDADAVSYFVLSIDTHRISNYNRGL